MKPRENEIVKRRSPRQSAKEAAKKLKRNFAPSSGEEDDESFEISHPNQEFFHLILFPSRITKKNVEIILKFSFTTCTCRRKFFFNKQVAETYHFV